MTDSAGKSSSVPGAQWIVEAQRKDDIWMVMGRFGWKTPFSTRAEALAAARDFLKDYPYVVRIRRMSEKDGELVVSLT